jgi:hypothetical protein
VGVFNIIPTIISNVEYFCHHDLGNVLAYYYINVMNNQEIKDKIALLEKELTGDMFQDMDIKDQIHVLQMKLTGTKPEDSEIDCFGCGS